MTHSSELLSTYSVPLIILSFVIAACASFCALELVGHVSNAQAFTRRLWLFAGAATFGLGTWAMHFIGMLAFDLNMPIGYHLPTVLFSMFPVMAATAFALSLAARLFMRRQPLTDQALLAALLRLPFMTARVMLGIHWQALKLWFKGAIFHRAPRYDPSQAAKESA